MKFKIALVSITVIAFSVILFAGCKHPVSNDKSAIIKFLDDFNIQAQAGKADSLSHYFETGNNKKSIGLLINVLSGKTNLGGKTKPEFKTTLNTHQCTVTATGSGLSKAVIPVNFAAEGMPEKWSTIIFTIHQLSNGSFRIISVNADGFRRDYLAYQRKAIRNTEANNNVYEPITLAAFKTADQLKARYDSVLWFEHVNKQTYFYVVKGTFNGNFYLTDDDAPAPKPTYKMGLLNPSLKEIIPPAYDLIHNIGGTIDGMVEVEKDDKRGLYSIAGKLVVPVDYEQIYPLKKNESEYLALLKKGADYFYLTKDLVITGKQADLKIADVLPKIKAFGSSYELSDKSSPNIMEYNDRESVNCVVLSPSYLVDWKIVPKLIDFQNPLRKHAESESIDGEGDVSMAISFDGTQKEEKNWLESVYYSVADEYLGARSGLYTDKTLLFVDKKQNQIMGFSASSFFGDAEGGGSLTGACNENSFKAINDSLFEFKTTSNLDHGGISEGPYYHYLQIKNGKLAALPGKRIFNFTQYIKMDDSYLRGCYVINTEAKPKTVNQLPDSLLEYMKNEIYASYGYKFKNPKWIHRFGLRITQGEEGKNANVDDSLTAIDKFNINFLANKLNGKRKIKNTTLAAK